MARTSSMGPFVAAAEQATRYARQIAVLDVNSPDKLRVFNAWQAFISQFSGNNREVLSRTFWQAYYS